MGIYEGWDGAQWVNFAPGAPGPVGPQGPAGSGGGTVTSVGIQGSSAINVTGSPITSSGVINLSLNSHLENLALNWRQGLLVQTSAGGTFEARSLQAGSGITITNADGVFGDPVISATGGGGGTAHLDLIGHVTASGNLDGPIYASLANEIPYAYDRMYFDWAIHLGSIPTTLGPIHTLPDTGTRTEYRQTIRTGVNSSGIYRAWDAYYSLDYSPTTDGKYSVDYTFVNNLNQLETVNAYKVQMVGNDSPSGRKSLFSISGNLDMVNGYIHNVLDPMVSSDVATKHYVDSQVGLNYPYDPSLFLNGNGNWVPPINYPGNPSFVLRGNGGWGPPINYPGDPNLFLNGNGNWVGSTSSWVTDEHLNFPELNIHWDSPDTSIIPTLSHFIQDIYSHDPIFVERYLTGSTTNNTQRGWQWSYFLGDEPNQNSAHAILKYQHQQQPLTIQPIDVQILQLTSPTPDISIQLGGRLNMNGNRISGLPAPLLPNDASTRDYVDTKIFNTGNIFNFQSDVNQLIYNTNLNKLLKPLAAIDFNGQILSNLPTPIIASQAASQAATKGYVDSKTLTYPNDPTLFLNGVGAFRNPFTSAGAITVSTGGVPRMIINTDGTLNLNQSRLTNIQNGASGQDAVNVNQLNVTNTNLTNLTSWFSQQASNYTYFSTGIGIGGTFTRSGSYGFLNAAGTIGTGGGTYPYSLDCSARIKATEFNAYSSIKRKNIIEEDRRVVEEEVIDIIKNIPFAKYEFKDKIKEGDGAYYGVIAEQLNEVLPSYVDMSSADFVPNIMKAADCKKISDGVWKIGLAVDASAISGSKLKIITVDKDLNVDIISIDKNAIKVSCSETLDNKLFVYGTYETCPTVSKQKIFELTSIAVRNLIKRVEILENLI